MDGMLMRNVTISVALLSCVAAARSDKPKKLQWQFDGHTSLPAAAAEAKRTGKRLLIGMAGSPT
jgi:hypothetical protein